MTTTEITQAHKRRIVALKVEKPKQYPTLESVTSPTLPTPQAAYYLNRAQQTIRIWACRECGPIRPVRVHGRLAWRTADIRALLGVS